MANQTIDQIIISYARQYGGGLPLTAKEICNAVVLWVQQYTAEQLNPNEIKSGYGIDIQRNYEAGTVTIQLNEDSRLNAQNLAEYLQGSESVIVDIDESGTKIEIHLDGEYIQKIDRALLTPISRPQANSLVGVDTTGAQYLVPQEEVGGALFKHFWSLSDNLETGLSISGYYLDKNSDTILEQIDLGEDMLDLDKLLKIIKGTVWLDYEDGDIYYGFVSVEAGKTMQGYHATIRGIGVDFNSDIVVIERHITLSDIGADTTITEYYVERL